MHEPDYNTMSNTERKQLSDLFPVQDVRRLGDLVDQHGADHELRLLERGLPDEEQRMLRSFRKFKRLVKKQGEVFTWQTGPAPAEVLITSDVRLIQDPQDLTKPERSVKLLPVL